MHILLGSTYINNGTIDKPNIYIYYWNLLLRSLIKMGKCIYVHVYIIRIYIYVCTLIDIYLCKYFMTMYRGHGFCLYIFNMFLNSASDQLKVLHHFEHLQPILAHIVTIIHSFIYCEVESSKSTII
jgi:hypothetical protein